MYFFDLGLLLSMPLEGHCVDQWEEDSYPSQEMQYIMPSIGNGGCSSLVTNLLLVAVLKVAQTDIL